MKRLAVLLHLITMPKLQVGSDHPGDGGNYSYILAFRGAENHTTGERFAFTSGTQLASARFNSSVPTRDALRLCEALCSSNPCCVGLTLVSSNQTGYSCHTVNATTSVKTSLSCISYQRLRPATCKAPPLASPAPVTFPIRGWSITCDQNDANRTALYPGVNLLLEGAPATALSSLYSNGVAVLARRNVEAPFAADGPCRSKTSPERQKCINLLAEQFRTNDTDLVGNTVARWSGVGLDEWTLANWTGVPGSGVPWPHGSDGAVADAAAILKAGYQEGRRRYPRTFAAAWVAEGIDDAFGELMRDGTFDVAMVEGYTVCWLPAHCWSAIDDQFPFLHWARTQGWINRTMLAFGKPTYGSRMISSFQSANADL